MRKVHYKVVLDVLVREDDAADVQDSFTGADFVIEADGEGDVFDVVDVSVENVEVSDSL